MKFFNNLPFAYKLLVSFAVMILMTIAVGYIGITSMYKMGDHSRDMYEVHAKSLADIQKMTEMFQRSRSNMLEVILLEDKSLQKNSNVKLHARVDDLKKANTAFSKRITAEFQSVVGATYEEYSKQVEAYLNDVNRASDLAMSGKKQQAENFWMNEGDAVRNKISASLDSLIAIHMRNSSELYNEQTAQESSSIQNVLVICVVGVIILFFLGVLATRAIKHPLTQLVEKANYIANGDLTVAIDYESKDEIGVLVQTFKKMTRNLEESIKQIIVTSSSLASATTQISSSIEEMAAGTQQQSNQATDVSASVEEMTQTISENSRSASTTLETAAVAKETALKGGIAVKEMVSGMKEIASVVNQSAITLKALGVSSNQIGEITSVIDDIADQTNLLALNAAIEAARAGEQGRGFAVVADEVRKLAERTTTATKEIAGMIKRIQNETMTAVTSMQEGTKKVDEGIHLADAAGKSLNEIVDISQRLTDMVGVIAAANEQQALASEEIAQSVQGMSTVTHQTATGLEQIAQSSDDLNQIAEKLQHLTQKFKISMNEEHSVYQAPVMHSPGIGGDRKKTSHVKTLFKKPHIFSGNKNGNGNGHGVVAKQDPEEKFSASLATESLHGNGHDTEE